MKKLKEILNESNMSAGIGVRGFGDVTGSPATNDDVENSHIQRVIQGANEHQQNVKGFVDTHNSTSVMNEPDDNWWAKPGVKGSALTALGKSNKSSKVITEEGVPANSVGSGEIAGLGVGPKGEPGVSVSSQTKHKRQNAQTAPIMSNILRRKPLDVPLVEMGQFAGHKTFKVPRHVYERTLHEKRKGKHWTKYIGDGDIGVAVREYANKNPKLPIIIEDEQTGYMCYARYGKK